MGIAPQLYHAKVMHKRLMPKINKFTYGVYYLAAPLSRLQELADGWRFGVNQGGILSFHDKDHGDKDGGDLTAWARTILDSYGVDKADGEIMLVCMPRVLGYVFNPVSFWLCLDNAGQLRAVISEVNNTFGEAHCYLCVHSDQRVIAKDDVMQAEKLFHVSPFMKREGYYEFRFAYEPETSLGVWIDYYTPEGEPLLLTALTGKLHPYNRATRRRLFWQHPHVTLKTIALIHWQALKLFAKGVKYICKPEQREVQLSKNGKLTKF